MKHLGLIPKITYQETADQFLPGTASVVTVHKAGTIVKAGTEVQITIFKFKPNLPFLRFTHTQEQAVEALEKLGVKTQILFKSTSNQENNEKVADMDPAARTSVDVGSVVKLYIYKYDETSVPSLRGQTEAGKVSSVFPEPGTKVKQEQPVTVYVKKMLTAVPDVMGKTEADALSTTKQVGFDVRVAYPESASIDKVIEQSQAAGKPVK